MAEPVSVTVNETVTIAVNEVGVSGPRGPAGPPLTYAGEWDASLGAFPVNASNGEYFVTSGGGAVDGENFPKGTIIVALRDKPSSTTFVGNWFKWAVPYATPVIESWAGDGTAGPFPLTVNPVDAGLIMVTINGVKQSSPRDFAIVDMPGAPSGKGLLFVAGAEPKVGETLDMQGALPVELGTAVTRADLITLVGGGTLQSLLGYKTVAGTDPKTALLASTEPSRGVGAIWEAGGHSYEEVASGEHLTTAGGVKLKVLAGGEFNALAYGAVCDGVADDTSAIQTAAAHMQSLGAGKTLYIPGTPLISGAVDFSGLYNIRMDGGGVGGGFRVNDYNLLEPVTFGASQIFGGRVEGFNITRAAYSGATENVGVAFYDVAGATFIDIDTRFSKYPARFYLGASGQRVAYNTFINFRATGGFRNISVASAGTGYTNENVFIGGRCFTTADTETNIYIDQNVNHWRFYAMSLEGSGAQAVYLNGSTSGGIHSVMFDQCRTEGTWSADDVVLGANTLRCEVRGWNLYSTVTDDGVDNLIQAPGTSQQTTSLGGATTQTFRNRSVSDASVVDLRSLRDTVTAYAWRAIRDGDGLVRGYCTTRGDFYGFTAHFAGTGWSNPPLRVENFRIFDDPDGVLRVKDGVPSSATDGYPFGLKVAVPASATAGGKPGWWAADDSYHYTYTGDGTTHKWRRVAHASW
jgi:hypothetical protein